MGDLSRYIENKVLDHLLGVAAYTPETNIYVGLSTADPTNDGSGISEHTPGSDGYSRQSIQGTSAWDVAASRATANSALIQFSQATADWASGSDFTHWFLCNHATNTTFGTDVELIAYGSLTTAKPVLSGNTPSFAIGEFDISFNASGSGGGLTTAIANEMLDHIFRGEVYTHPATVYIALCTSTQTTTELDNGTWTEVTNANNYARVSFDSFAAASGGATQNSSAITFNVCQTATWGNIKRAIITTSGTWGAGDDLIWLDITAQDVNVDDTVEYATGDLDIAMT